MNSISWVHELKARRSFRRQTLRFRMALKEVVWYGGRRAA